MDPEQHPAELAGETLSVRGTDESRVMVKLPRADAVRPDVHDGDGDGIDDERQQSGDPNVRPRRYGEQGGNERMHHRDDDGDEKTESYSPRDRSTVQPPQRRVTKMGGEGPEQPIFMDRVARREMARDPMETASRGARLSHGS